MKPFTQLASHSTFPQQTIMLQTVDAVVVNIAAQFAQSLSPAVSHGNVTYNMKCQCPRASLVAHVCVTHILSTAII